MLVFTTTSKHVITNNYLSSLNNNLVRVKISSTNQRKWEEKNVLIRGEAQGYLQENETHGKLYLSKIKTAPVPSRSTLNKHRELLLISNQYNV